MKIKAIIKFLISFILCVGIECFVINLPYIQDSINNMSSESKNERLRLQDASAFNWTIVKDGLLSENDPIIEFQQVDKLVNSIYLRVFTGEEVNYVNVFYTTDETGTYGEPEHMSTVKMDANRKLVRIDDYVYSLRVDIGEIAGMKLKGIEVVINPVQIHFSVARVIAMLLLYYGTNALFCLHRSPDYELE